jgi:hypothetical protein
MLPYAKQKKYELIKDYYDRFLHLCAIIPLQTSDIHVREFLKKGLRTKVRMAIIGMPQRTLAEMAISAISIKEEIPIRKRNMVRHHENSNSDEFDELNDKEQVKPKRKGAKVQFDTCRRGVHCQKCYNDGHFTKECKLLIKKKSNS